MTVARILLLKEKLQQHYDYLISEAARLLKLRDATLKNIGNIVHSSVPYLEPGVEEVVRYWNTKRCEKLKGFELRTHDELLRLIGGIESKSAVKIAGHRAYFLKDVAVLLNQALINYGIKFLRDREYTPIQPPFFMRRESMAQTAELKDFEETLYKIPEGAEQTENNEYSRNLDLFLIATSEQPISTLHCDGTMDEKSVPLRYAGVSTCFRREAGSHGKDTLGLFRVHQFEKVEQFIYCAPEQSWEIHEEMLKISEAFLQTLDIPYRVVCLPSNDLNNAAAKKYDIEGWFPAQRAYKELVSCSNCTDYQARELNCRLGAPKMGDREKRFVHMLNGTLVASQRTMCCILENYQNECSVTFPDVLLPYMDGTEYKYLDIPTKEKGKPC